MSANAGRRADGHRNRPKRHSPARVNTTIDSAGRFVPWGRGGKHKTRVLLAPRIKDWEGC